MRLSESEAVSVEGSLGNILAEAGILVGREQDREATVFVPPFVFKSRLVAHS